MMNDEIVPCAAAPLRRGESGRSQGAATARVTPWGGAPCVWWRGGSLGGARGGTSRVLPSVGRTTRLRVHF